MSTTSVPAAHLPPLGDRAREEVGGELQATLIELIDLALVGKQLHWSVVGPLFRPLDLQLDELIDAWRELGDAVAERAIAIGYWPDGQADAVVAVASGSDSSAGPCRTRPSCRRSSGASPRRASAPGHGRIAWAFWTRPRRTC
jgi:starvation-inducible DNA-binding protein